MTRTYRMTKTGTKSGGAMTYIKENAGEILLLVVLIAVVVILGVR